MENPTDSTKLRITISFGFIAAMLASAFLIEKIFSNELFTAIWFLTLFLSVFLGIYILFTAIALTPKTSILGHEKISAFFFDCADNSYSFGTTFVVLYIFIIILNIISPETVKWLAGFTALGQLTNYLFYALVIIIIFVVIMTKLFGSKSKGNVKKIRKKKTGKKVVKKTNNIK